jgi:membrane protein implicated in regulation of membrane protease activity
MGAPYDVPGGTSSALGGFEMGYGFGGFLVVVGLILALAVTDNVSGVDLTMVGWIMTGVGILLLALTAASWGRRGVRSVSTTTYADGTQSVSERRTQV